MCFFFSFFFFSNEVEACNATNGRDLIKRNGYIFWVEALRLTHSPPISFPVYPVWVKIVIDTPPIVSSNVSPLHGKQYDNQVQGGSVHRGDQALRVIL